MPASTLHKSAQQGAPDAYISLCKSTTQDTRVQKMPTSTPMSASKRCPRRPHTRVERYARRPPMRAYNDARATSIRAAKTYARRPPPACAKDGRANMDARKDARVAPCYSRRKDTRVRAVTGVVTESSRLCSSSHVLPHDQEQREGRFRL